MAFAQGRFGIAYEPERQDEGPNLVGWTVVLVLAVAAISLMVALVKRHRKPEGDIVEPPPPPVSVVATVLSSETTAPLPPGFKDVYAQMATRPTAVRKLLITLREAQEKGDWAKEVETLNRLRDLPGNPALDLNSLLAQRLGTLNLEGLFTRRNPQWVKKVKVRPGDSATRLAQENGTTLAAVKRLNPDRDLGKIRPGDELWVMDHPRFYLCVYPNTRTADLSLKGRFFKRYDLHDSVSGKAGTYEPTGSLRLFLAEHGVWFRRGDREELETLLPKKFTFVIGDL